MVVDVARKMGVALADADISVSHRTGADGAGPIIVRFARREKKIEMMRKKKNLGNEAGIFIEEDLTRIRHRMLYEIRHDSRTTKTWTIEGKIFAMMKEGEGANAKEAKKTFKNPDDLYKLGWNEERLTRFLRECGTSGDRDDRDDRA